MNPLDNRFSAGQGYNYDLAGNVTTNATGMQFVYDAENHQTEARDAGGFVVGQYFYDGEGKRVKKVSNTETTVFVYDGGGTLVAEYSSQGNPTASVKYLTQDHLGSPRVITDQNGAVVSRTDFGAFGDETFTPQRTSGLGYSAADGVRQDYTGYQKDDESGLEYAQARYYNPAHGRFTSIDPLTASASIRNPQTFNRYSYVLNSPYKFTDPLGLLSISTGACGQFCHGGLDGTGGGGGGLDPRNALFFYLLRRQNAQKPEPPPHGPAGDPQEAGSPQPQHQPGEPESLQNSQQTQPSDEAEFTVRTEINSDFRIISFKAQYLDKDKTGQVPVGGRFRIVYRFAISTPVADLGDEVEDLGSYGNIESTIKGGGFAATESLENLVTDVKIVGTRGTSTIIEKTETFRVLPDKGSQISKVLGGTRAINYVVVIRNSASAGAEVIRERSNSRLGKYIEVRIPSRN